MKKLKVLSILSLFILSPLHGEEVFKYNKISKDYKDVAALTVIGASVSLSAYKILPGNGYNVYNNMVDVLDLVTRNKRIAEETIELGIGLTLLSSFLSSVVGTGGFISLSLEGANLFDFDRKSIINEFKALKFNIMATTATKQLPNNKEFQEIVSKFNCIDCPTEQSVALAYSKMFREVSSIARKFVNSKDFDKRDLNRSLEKADLETKMVEILGKNYTKDNYKMALTIFAMALVYEAQ